MRWKIRCLMHDSLTYNPLHVLKQPGRIEDMIWYSTRDVTMAVNGSNQPSPVPG